MNSYEATRRRHLAYVGQRLADHLQRLTWSADRLRQERTRRLRGLLKVACDGSSWHRRRLSKVDITSIDEDHMGELPVMTKQDLMDHFDDIVTDRRVTIGLVNGYLAHLTSDAYLLDEYHALASGGSSGLRGVFVWGWDAWATCWLISLRNLVAHDHRHPAPAAGPRALMLVTAEHPWHLSAALGQTFATSEVPVHRIPVTMPLDAIVDGLNRVQGDTLMTYGSMLATLVAEAEAGRLAISPRRILSVADPLLPEVRAAAVQVWGAPIANSWGTSEGGIVARGCYLDTGMHLSDDLLIVEPVDGAGRPVPAGTESAKVYLTNLYNPLLPIIRYEITDQVTILDQSCACGSQHRRVADIQGRLDDMFTYHDALAVHPHLFRSVLARDPRIVEYQVRQTPTGAAILARTTQPIEAEHLAEAIEAGLARAGLVDPAVTVTTVDQLPRVGVGKLKRFVPLGPAEA